MQESSPFFTSSSVLVCRLLMTVILTVVRWYLINLICISLIISNIEHLSMCLLAVCLWDRRFWCGVEINREFLGYTCWGWKHRPEWVYLGRHYNARSLQLSLEELHHILVVLSLSFAVIARPWPKPFAPQATPLKFEILDLMKWIGKHIVHLFHGYL